MTRSAGGGGRLPWADNASLGVGAKAPKKTVPAAEVPAAETFDERLERLAAAQAAMETYRRNASAGSRGSHKP